jgi:hypothetical protein
LGPHIAFGPESVRSVAALYKVFFAGRFEGVEQFEGRFADSAQRHLLSPRGSVRAVSRACSRQGCSQNASPGERSTRTRSFFQPRPPEASHALEATLGEIQETEKQHMHSLLGEKDSVHTEFLLLPKSQPGMFSEFCTAPTKVNKLVCAWKF